MEIEVIAAKRELQGTGASRRLRHAGKVPGIVYGGAAAPVQIEPSCGASIASASRLCSPRQRA